MKKTIFAFSLFFVATSANSSESKIKLNLIIWTSSANTKYNMKALVLREATNPTENYEKNGNFRIKILKGKKILLSKKFGLIRNDILNSCTDDICKNQNDISFEASLVLNLKQKPDQAVLYNGNNLLKEVDIP